MGHYNNYHVIVKPKKEYLDSWKKGGENISDELKWLKDKEYRGSFGLFELDETPYISNPEYVEFRGNSKNASVEGLLDYLDQLDEYIILIHNDCRDYIDAFLSTDLSIPFENELFRLVDREIIVHNRFYDISENDCYETEARSIMLNEIEIADLTFLTNYSIHDFRWNALTSKYFEEIMKLSGE